LPNVRTFPADIRFGLRMWVRAPGVTAAAVLSLALGIGANLAAFTLINATLLRPLPVPEPDRLVSFYYQTPEGDFQGFSHPEFLEFRGLREVFEDVAAFASTTAVVNTDGSSERVEAEATSPDYPAVTGLQMALGRWPEAQEASVAISESLWKRRFGGDTAVMGRVVRVNGQPFTVTGVVRGFSGMFPQSKVEVWAPLAWHWAVLPWGAKATREEVERSRLNSRGTEWLHVAARLKQGISPAQADAAARAVAARGDAQHPRVPKRGRVGVSAAGRGALTPAARQEVSERLQFVLAIAGLVLLSACANVGNLLLARASTRGHEIAIRLAVGAGRPRILRQFLTESVVLGMAGGAAALLAAMWAPGLLGSLRLPGGWMASDLDLRPDARVCWFALGLSLVAGVACGIAPAVRATGRAIYSTLRGAARGGSRGRLRACLVVVQVGVSTMLLVGAGLLLKSLDKRFGLDPGFPGEELLMVSFETGADEVRGKAFYGELARRARTLPGVTSAALSFSQPLAIWRLSWSAVVDGNKVALDGNAVTPGYFATMGIGIVEGRGFTDADAAWEQGVAVVTERTARRLWPGRSAVGAQFTAAGRPMTVVGVARESYHHDFRTLMAPGRPFAYVHSAQQYWPRQTLLLRTPAPPAAVMAALNREVHAIDPEIVPVAARTARQHVNFIFAEERTTALVAAALGLLALVLSVAGIYGVVSYWVAERTREIGIRMALGARSPDALGMVLRQAAMLAGTGVALGLAAAMAGTRALSGMLFGVTARDPAVFGAAAAVLLAVALAAGYLPARRATRVDPMVALRHE
jgi:predicted permease